MYIIDVLRTKEAELRSEEAAVSWKLKNKTDNDSLYQVRDHELQWDALCWFQINYLITLMSQMMRRDNPQFEKGIDQTLQKLNFPLTVTEDTY